MKTLRDYQDRAIYGNEHFPGVLRALDEHPSTLLVMATGLGKTVVMSKIANDWTKGNVLCFAHRIELVDQMADTLAGELGYRPSVEQSIRGLDRESLFAAGHVVVGSIQSMITENRLRKFRDHPFGLIIIDEAHRATSPSYVKLVDRYSGGYRPEDQPWRRNGRSSGRTGQPWRRSRDSGWIWQEASWKGDGQPADEALYSTAGGDVGEVRLPPPRVQHLLRLGADSADRRRRLEAARDSFFDQRRNAPSFPPRERFSAFKCCNPIAPPPSN